MRHISYRKGIVWRQGSGAYGDGAGPLTDEPIDVGAYCGGIGLYINAYDEYGDSWNGGTYQLLDAAGGGGILLASNGGATPDGFGDS